MSEQPLQPIGEFLLYQTEDAQTRIQVRLINETLWPMQKQLADLYQVGVSTINEHLKNIYADRELEAERTIRKFRIVALEGVQPVKTIETTRKQVSRKKSNKESEPEQ